MPFRVILYPREKVPYILQVPDFALKEGLFEDGFEPQDMKNKGWAGLGDFHALATKLGIF